MCRYVYIRLIIAFFLLRTFGTPWANYSAAFPENVRQCRGLVRALMWEPYYFFLDPGDDQAESRRNKCNESAYQENTQGGFLIVIKK